MEWLYFFREIVLLFVGINLAIWFNNWNENRKLKSVIRKSIGFIKLELQSNLEILETNKIKLQDFYNELSLYSSKKSERSEAEIIQFNNENKMVKVTEEGGLTFTFDYPILSLKNTSWEILKTRNAFNKLNYKCVYNLEDCYQLIMIFQNEFNKSLNSLQDKEVEKFIATLNYITQLNPKLQTLIKETIENLRNSV